MRVKGNARVALNEREKEKVSALTTPVVNVASAWQCLNDIEGPRGRVSLWPRVFFSRANGLTRDDAVTHPSEVRPTPPN